jgi:hypothetical protein
MWEKTEKTVTNNIRRTFLFCFTTVHPVWIFSKFCWNKNEKCLLEYLLIYYLIILFLYVIAVISFDCYIHRRRIDDDCVSRHVRRYNQRYKNKKHFSVLLQQ